VIHCITLHCVVTYATPVAEAAFVMEICTQSTLNRCCNVEIPSIILSCLMIVGLQIQTTSIGCVTVFTSQKLVVVIMRPFLGASLSVAHRPFVRLSLDLSVCPSIPCFRFSRSKKTLGISNLVETHRWTRATMGEQFFRSKEEEEDIYLTKNDNHGNSKH